ncbi:Bug family tripartite tricarboxylate transporter substrate binding protein [Variovorax sp. M-6]|uniref:Bug family tripartite tricarboxylate transporter substrate binding protein n=1 Tax=Variovorax sp. M-6 TaxID=3233041 RepID=UPI003F9C71A1
MNQTFTVTARPCRLRRRLLGAAMAGLLHLGMAQAEEAQIRIIVSLPAGGGVDAMARYLGQQLGQTMQRTVVVENRPGGSGTIAAKAVLNPVRGQTTLLAGGNQEITIAPHLLNDAAYRPLESLRPLVQVGTVPSVVVARPGPEATQDRLLQALGSSAGVAIGTPGLGTPMHIALEEIAQQSRARFLHVPYKGAPDVLAGVLAGSTPYGAVGYPAARNLIESGRLVAVSVLSQTRSSLVAGVPAVAEKIPLGNDVVQVWYGLFAAAKTPPDELRKIEQALAAVMKDEAVRKRLQELGIQVTALSPAAFGRELQAESDYYRKALVAYKVQ